MASLAKTHEVDGFWTVVLVAFSSMLSITFVTLFGLLGDQLVPSMGSFELLVLVSAIIAIIGIEAYFAVLLIAARLGRNVKTPWRKLDAFESRHAMASTAWSVTWSIVHLIIGTGLIAACIWLALQYIPIMEPRYFILGYLIVGLAASMFVMYMSSSIKVFRQLRMKGIGTRPKMGRGTMVPLLVAVVAIVPVVIYHVPAYYVEKWGLDIANVQNPTEYDLYGGWANPPAGSGLENLTATDKEKDDSTSRS